VDRRSAGKTGRFPHSLMERERCSVGESPAKRDRCRVSSVRSGSPARRPRKKTRLHNYRLEAQLAREEAVLKADAE
jgi:hypothetical protein